MSQPTQTPTHAPDAAAKKQEVTQKLRDLSLDDLDGVVGGMGARCDMDGASSLAE